MVEVRTTAPPTVATIYGLTPWGQELYGIVVRLGRWGARRLVAGPEDRVFRAHFVIPVIHALYSDAELDGVASLSVRIDHDDEHVRITVGDGDVDAVIDDHPQPADVVIEGPPDVVLGLLAGVIDPRDHVGAAVPATREATRRFRAWTARAAPVR